jgi:ABC-type multidrug transport system ATPase subunit
MDPEARRFMWSVVAKIAQRKTSAVVLTTHSMEEAEALSTKMGIMVKGGIFKCFGSSQHIKNKFGTGFAIEIKVKTVLEEELHAVEQKYFVEGKLCISEDLNLSSDVIDMVTTEAAKCLGQAEKLRFVHNLIN